MKRVSAILLAAGESCRMGEVNKLTLPVGIGIAKTMVFNGTPWKFALQYWYFVESPDAFGPDYQVRFQVAPVVPLPW